jgi:integrase
MATSFSLKDFLDSQTRPRTIESYRNGIIRFSKWFGKSPEEILQMRQDDLTKRPDEDQIDYLNRAGRFERELVKYHKQALDRGISKNSARTYTVGVIQLFRHYKMPILLDNSQKKISKTVKTANSFPLTIEHVRKMYQMADIKDKVLLSLATDLGIRIGDFLSLRIDELPDLNEEPPVSFERNTIKEDVPATHFLSGETVDLLKIYLPTLSKNENLYLFPNKNGGHITDVWFNELIRNLASKAGIQFNGKKLSSHCFRKMFRSASVTAGYETAGKKICGVTIEQSEDTYYNTVNLREPFIEIKKFLTIQNQNGKTSESIESLRKTISDMDRKHKEEIEYLQNIIKSHTERLDLLHGMVMLSNLTDEQHKKLNKVVEQITAIPDEEYALLSPDIDKKLEEEIPKITGSIDNKYIITEMRKAIDNLRKNKKIK